MRNEANDRSAAPSIRAVAPSSAARHRPEERVRPTSPTGGGWNATSIIGYDMRQVLPAGIHLTMDTLEGTCRLFEDPPASLKPIWSGQDDALAAEMGEASQVPLPGGVRPGDFISTPLDVMAYTNPSDGSVRFACLEFNSLAYAGIFNLPPGVLRGIQDTLNRFGEEFKHDPSALILVGSSGRQQPKDPRNPEKLEGSTIIYEKIWLADAIAQGMRGQPRLPSVEVVSYDDPAVFRTWAEAAGSTWHAARPIIVVGYMRDFIERAGVEVKNGVPYFFGRRVKGIVNDRFVASLAASHGRLDATQFRSVNITSHIGTDKMEAYRVANEFNGMHGALFPTCSRHIKAEYAADREQMLRVIRAFLSAGEKAIIKPHNTAWGHGIQIFLDPNESDAEIGTKIDASLAEVQTNYNSKAVIAGFPYTVTQYLEARRIRAVDRSSPYHYAHDCRFEIRIAAYADYRGKSPTLKACPAIVKLNLLGLNVCNISIQKMKTGRAWTDFILPLCTRDTLALLNLSEAQMLELCKWSTGYVAHALTGLRT